MSSVASVAAEVVAEDSSSTQILSGPYQCIIINAKYAKQRLIDLKNRLQWTVWVLITTWFRGTALFIMSLGLYHSLYKARRFIRRFPQPLSGHYHWQSNGVSESPDSELDRQWKEVLGELKKGWIQDSVGCAIFLPISVSLLQIDAVSDDLIGRTTAIAGFVFSCSGLLLSIILISRFGDGRCRDEWIKASESVDDLDSITFWSVLAYPQSFFCWSTIYCAATVLMLAWTAQNGSLLSGASDSLIKTGNIVSTILLISLTVMILAIPVNQAIKVTSQCTVPTPDILPL